MAPAVQHGVASMSTRNKMLGLAALVAAALALVMARRDPATPAAAPTLEAAVSPAARLEEVERVVAERNKNVGKEERVFEADGWEMVSAPPPDPRVTSLDPSLIAEGREDELRVQVASVSPNSNHARRLGQILLMAREPATREHASLALGRIRTAEAQDEIVRVLTSGKLDPEDYGRRQLAALLRPTDLDDEIAARMANLLDSEALTSVEKEQVAFTLALVGLRDGMQLPENVLATVSPTARGLIEHMTEMGQRNFLVRGHDHGAHRH